MLGKAKSLNALGQIAFRLKPVTARVFVEDSYSPRTPSASPLLRALITLTPGEISSVPLEQATVHAT